MYLATQHARRSSYARAASHSTRYIDHDILCIVMTRHDICLPRELRNPETVDHVVREQFNVYPRSDGDIQFIGGNDVGVSVQVVELPPPLMPDRSHVYRPGHSWKTAQIKHRVDGSNE